MLHIKYVDVFTDRALRGNPVAVILGGDSLDDRELQRLAQWTNLSETTFVLPSDVATYRLRIFTPRTELPFAGHPTLGSAHAACEVGWVPGDQSHFTQECGAGIISLSVGSDGALHAQVPTPRFVPIADAAEAVARELGAAFGGVDAVDPRLIDVGPVWLVARIDGALVNELQPDLTAVSRLCRRIEAIGVTVYALSTAERLAAELAVGEGESPDESPAVGETTVREDGIAEPGPGSRLEPSVVVRSFVPDEGVFEDPVCGSGNAAVAAHVEQVGSPTPLANPYVAAQGEPLGRAGRVHVLRRDGDVIIGGHCVTVVEGLLRL